MKNEGVAMKRTVFRLTPALLAVLTAVVFLSGCSHDQSGAADNQQLTKDRQAKIEAHKAQP